MKSRSGITPIESAAVVACTAFALSLMLPFFAAERERARGVICKSRLGQLGLACTEYAIENDGVTLNFVGINYSVPPGDSSRVQTGIGWDICALTCNGDNYSGLGLLFSTGILEHSRESARLFYCPSIPEDNMCSADFIDPDLDPVDDSYGMTNLDRIMFDDWSVPWAIQILTGVQVRNKWASGVFPNGPFITWTLESMPSQWGFDLVADRKKAFIADPWPGYHNSKGTAWYLDGHVESWSLEELQQQDWYYGPSAYYHTFNVQITDPPRYTQDQIFINYGMCFRWLDESR